MTFPGTFPTALFASGYVSSLSTSFDGVDEYVTTTADLSGVTTFSIGGWFYRTDTGHRMDIAQSNLGNTTRFKLLNHSAGTILVIISSSSGTFTFGTTGWTHIVSVYDGGGVGNSNRLKLYINGIKRTLSFSGTVPAVMPTINRDLVLGRDDGSLTYGTGNLDEVAHFNIALSDSDVTEWYNSGETFDLNDHSANANLANYWRMGEGDTHPTIIDHAGSDNGTMINMAAGNFSTEVP